MAYVFLSIIPALHALLDLVKYDDLTPLCGVFVF